VRSSLVLCAVLLACRGAAASGGEEGQFDPRVRAMLGRAMEGEEPTADDRRVALRALRDWELSESEGETAGGDDRRVRSLLRSVAGGERVPEHLRPLAARLNREYLSDEGLALKLRNRPRGTSPALPAGRRNPSSSAMYWLLLAACVTVVIGGVVVWALSRRRRRPDYHSYYS
jgi:hypothetical protein